jgi:hypothetical protein
MRYDKEKYDEAVKIYKKILGKIKRKTILIILDLKDEGAYYSLAPLSEAIHSLGGDINVIVKDKKSEGLAVLEDVWECYEQMKKGIKNEKTKALREFINEVEKKTKGKFERIFVKPDYIIEAKQRCFEGDFVLPYNTRWFKKYRYKKLLETAKIIWKDVYNLKKNERVSLGFELMPARKDLELPLGDYLDSFQICRAMMVAAKQKVERVRMGSSSVRQSMLEPCERISDLTSTLLGCELDKEVKEPIFRKFKKLSYLLRINRLKTPTATYFIHAKGYPGKHLFGEVIGYPSLDRKTRWQSPGQMIYKLDFYPQTKLEKREPMARVGFTGDPLPIDLFIQTCNIDWMAMKRRDDKIKRITESSEVIMVVGKKIKGLQTRFEVGLRRKDGTHRWARGSDVEIRDILNREYLNRTGIRAGNMSNIPGGEMFTTPEYVEGTIVGDVVIFLDRSYVLSENKPLVIKSNKKGYKVVSGQKIILEQLRKKKREAWKSILEQEKHKGVPKEIIKLKKKNFNKIGEFAINTNPKAKLCRYLIVNEKIARMIHVALGSGFEPDRATEYHVDIVINSPQQKMDIYGIDKRGRKLWIIRKGRFVV